MSTTDLYADLIRRAEACGVEAVACDAGGSIADSRFAEGEAAAYRHAAELLRGAVDPTVALVAACQRGDVDGGAALIRDMVAVDMRDVEAAEAARAAHPDSPLAEALGDAADALRLAVFFREQDAASLRAKVAAAVEEERAACARVADREDAALREAERIDRAMYTSARRSAAGIADAIRARGESPRGDAASGGREGAE